MKKLPLGIQNIREIIQGDYVYVDKTKFVYDLINDAKYYFLSRPRRFGKSLLLDTIYEVFSGDKELFRGLWIYDSGYVFEKHPVIRLDMSNIANSNPQILGEELMTELGKRFALEGVDANFSSPSTVLKNLIEELYKKYDHRVVVLVDEYDKPILDHLDDVETAEANRKVLKAFYGVLKSMDPYLGFIFITGGAKFTKTSIFSELNNLLDITLSKKYANICGVPVSELDGYFSDYIKMLSQQEEFRKYSSLYDEILAWYDGYSWDGKTKLLNPFSLLSFFSQGRFFSFWYASGTPTFLIKLIKSKPESFIMLSNLKISERVLDSFDIYKMGVVPLLFQTGYLTIKDRRYGEAPESYLLSIPNLEVSEALNMNIVAEFTEKEEDITEASYRKIKKSLRAGDLQVMLETLRSLFASVPYQLHIDREAYYHSIFYAVMSVLGFDVDAEVSVSKGRIDAVLELYDTVYVMEFKYNDCAPDAAPEVKQKMFEDALSRGMAQISNVGYQEKYAGTGKKICLAAFAFLGRSDIEMRFELL